MTLPIRWPYDRKHGAVVQADKLDDTPVGGDERYRLTFADGVQVEVIVLLDVFPTIKEASWREEDR